MSTSPMNEPTSFTSELQQPVVTQSQIVWLGDKLFDAGPAGRAHRIDGAGITRDQAERAIQLAVERYCSVAASLSSDIVTEARLTLNGEAGTPVRLNPWVPADGGA